MNPLCKTAKTLDTVFKLFRIVVVIACVASVIAAAFMGAALLFDLDTETLGITDQILEIGVAKLTLAEGASLPLSNALGHSLVEMAMILVLSVATLFAISYIRAILHPMTEGEPFRDVVAVNLKKLAWLQIIYGGVRFFLDGVEQALFNHFYGDALKELLEGSKISSIVYESESDLTFLLIAGVLFLLSYVFRYAQELQKLSDETL